MISTLMTYWYDKDHRYVVTLDDIFEYLTIHKVKIRNVKLWELKKFRKFDLNPQVIKESRKNLQRKKEEIAVLLRDLRNFLKTASSVVVA